jgi:hypothetical protein
MPMQGGNLLMKTIISKMMCCRTHGHLQAFGSVVLEIHHFAGGFFVWLLAELRRLYLLC